MSNYQKQQSFFGIMIDDVSHESVQVRVCHAMNNANFLRIATVNPAFLLMARKDVKFRKNLVQAELRIADGKGVSLMSRLFGQKITQYAGVDLFFDTLALAEKNGWVTYFYCHADGLSQWRDVREALQEKYPKLCVAGEDVNLGVHKRYEQCKKVCHNNVVKKCVADVGDVPQIFFINFGAPMQEYFAEQLRADGARGVVIGVGGSFDFLTGKMRRAPRWMQCSGVEWLWRLWQQPWRVRRIIESVIFFPCVVLWEKVISKK